MHIHDLSSELESLIKSTALATIDAMLEVYKPGSVITQESLAKYREELDRSNFAEDALRWIQQTV